MIDRRVEEFLLVAAEGSVSKAAKRSFVSPQALQQQMNALEKEAGHTLFKRSPRGIELTAAGEAFKAGAEELVAVRDRTMRQVAMAASAGTRTLRLGAQSYLQAQRLISAASSFHRRYPWVPIEVVALCGEPEFDRYVGWLKRGDIDIMQAVCPLGGNPDPELRVTRFNKIETCCVLPPDSPLCAAALLEPDDLRGCTVMTHRVSVSSTMAKALYAAGLEVEIIKDGGERPSSLLEEVNEVLSGKVLVVPEPYARQLFDLPRVPLAIESFYESFLCRAERDKLCDLFVAHACGENLPAETS